MLGVREAAPDLPLHAVVPPTPAPTQVLPPVPVPHVYPTPVPYVEGGDGSYPPGAM